jgi:hypothetical protein
MSVIQSSGYGCNHQTAASIGKPIVAFFMYNVIASFIVSKKNLEGPAKCGGKGWGAWRRSEGKGNRGRREGGEGKGVRGKLEEDGCV